MCIQCVSEHSDGLERPIFVWSACGVCILDLVLRLWGLGYILPHGGLLVLLDFLAIHLEDHSSHLVFVFCLLYLCLVLSFTGGEGLGF